VIAPNRPWTQAHGPPRNYVRRRRVAALPFGAVVTAAASGYVLRAAIVAVLVTGMRT
jgi:hypothetical protein